MTTGRINQVAPFKRQPKNSRAPAQPPWNPCTRPSRAGVDFASEVRFRDSSVAGLSALLRPFSFPKAPQKSSRNALTARKPHRPASSALWPLPANASFVRAERNGGPKLKARFHYAPPVLAPTHSYACASRINTSLQASTWFRHEAGPDFSPQHTGCVKSFLQCYALRAENCSTQPPASRHAAPLFLTRAFPRTDPACLGGPISKGEFQEPRRTRRIASFVLKIPL